MQSYFASASRWLQTYSPCFKIANFNVEARLSFIYGNRRRVAATCLRQARSVHKQKSNGLSSSDSVILSRVSESLAGTWNLGLA